MFKFILVNRMKQKIHLSENDKKELKKCSARNFTAILISFLSTTMYYLITDPIGDVFLLSGLTSVIGISVGVFLFDYPKFFGFTD